MSKSFLFKRVRRVDELGTSPEAALTRRIPFILGIYLIAITAAEALTTLFPYPALGMALHGALLAALVFHAALTHQKELRPMLLSLAVAPLIRLMSLSLPLAHFPMIQWYLLIGLPLFIAVFMVARYVGYQRKDLGITLRGWPTQLLIGVVGLILGLLEYLILRPQPLAESLSLTQLWLPAMILLIFTGLLEEYIFRGVMQKAFADGIGQWRGLLYISLLFAVLHLGYNSFPDFMFVLIVALIFGWIALRTNSILGVTLAHGLTNISLFLIFPLLFSSPAPALAAGELNSAAPEPITQTTGAIPNYVPLPGTIPLPNILPPTRALGRESGISANICTETGTMTVLLLGASLPDDPLQRGADAIRLVKVDFAKKEVTLLALPPYLQVQTPDGKSLPLTQVYYAAKEATAGNEQTRVTAATEAVANALAYTFGYQAEHYFTVQQETFSEIVDALGGVTVTLTDPVYSASPTVRSFPAGTQTLDGAAARDLVRLSGTASDEWSRMSHQEKVLLGIYQAIKSPANFSRLPVVAETFYEDVATDFSLPQVVDMLCLARQSGVVVNMAWIGPDLVEYQNGRTLYPDTAAIRAYLQAIVGK